MTKEELQEIIDRFNEEELKQLGLFGIFQYGGGSEESFIKSNKEGLELFALELLKSARDTETILQNKENHIIPFKDHENWIDAHSKTFIHYVEPVAGKQQSKSGSDYKPSFSDRISFLGCVFIALILISSILVGFFTIVGWLF